MADGQKNQLWPEPEGTTGEIIPINRDPQGKLHPAWPGMIRSAVNNVADLVTAPGNALQGKLSPEDALALAPKVGQLALTDSPLGLAEGAGAEAGNDLVHNMFAGIRAKTANMPKLSQALTMEGRGQAPANIHAATGWFRGPDQKWRFEIPDTNAKTPFFDKSHVQDGASLPLGKFLNHPDVHSAYPQLQNIPVSAEDLPGGSGIYYPSDKSIGLTSMSRKDTLSATLHETQHAIQDIEGFAKGGSPDDFLTADHHNRAFMQEQNWDKLQGQADKLGVDPDAVMTGMQRFAQQRPLGDAAYDVKALGNQSPQLLEAFRQHYNNGTVLDAEKKQAYENYNNLAGEVEARNVQERHAQGYGPETFPLATPGIVPQDKQIILMPDGQKAALSAVDHDPFAPPSTLIPVEHDPWQHTAEPVNHDPFANAEDSK